VVRQYPHTLQYITPGTPAYQDAEGYWVEGEPGSLEELRCRLEPAGAGALLTTADGQQVAFRYSVFFPKGTDRLPYGTEVKVFSGEELLAEETVLQFSKGQLSAKAWL
jgi:hypothetical protein